MVQDNVAQGASAGGMAIDELQGSFRGDLLRPGAPAYDDARKIWNGMIDHQPKLIARCMSAADVIRAVGFAQRHAMPVSIHSGGHSIAGNCMIDGGLVIDLSRMKGIRVDPAARTARAEPGLTWGEFDRETQAFGLATTGGVVSTTGIAGLTLGGGVGWLNPRFGLACDNLISADVVTADGNLLTASETQHPDLFWALRGGGGNFGVVTSFEYRVHPLGQILAGMVVHPADRIRDVLRFYREITADLPDELTVYMGVVTAPDGNLICPIVACYSGDDLAEGERLIEPIRRFGPPVADMIQPMPYVALQSMIDEAFPAGRHSYWKSSLFESLSDDLLETIAEQALAVTSPYSAVFLENYHGAYSRVDPTATAYPHRNKSYDLVVIANWADPVESERHIGWARQFFQAAQPHTGDSVYINFLTGDDGADRVRAAYGPNYERLVAVKNRYDPTNFFRGNQNIRPQ